jgi:hypothetical protein
LEKARALVTDETDYLTEIELDLVEAMTAGRMGDLPTLLTLLRHAVARIDSNLIEAGRLHYRRGIREHFRPRISTMVALPS